MSGRWACGPEYDMDLRAFSPDATGALRLYGGGGGGSSQKNYAGLERLYQEQADSARLLRTQAEANLPGAVTNYVGKVNQITAPGYAQQQAGVASADMASANAMERAATERELTSMGVNPNDPRFAGSMRATEVSNAARMAAGKNLARNDAQKYQLAVAQDAVGTFTGQSNSAATQMSGASSGLANLANQKTASEQNARAQQSANTSNMVGGAMTAWSMFKDGGEVTHPMAMKKKSQLEELMRKGTVVGNLVDPEGDGRNIMDNTVVGQLAKRFFKDGGEVRPLERHMLGGTAGGAQGNAGFFQMHQIDPPQQPVTRQQPQGPSMSDLVKAGKEAKATKDAGGFMQRMTQKGAAHTDKMGRLVGKFNESAGNQIQSHAAGMRMTPDQASAARDAYSAAAKTAADPKAAKMYADAAANISEGAGLAAAPAAESLGTAAATEGLAATAPGVAAEVGAAASGLGSAGAGAGATAASTSSLAAAAPGVSSAVTGAASGLGTAATTAASTGLGAAAGVVGAALPWVGAAMAVGSLLGAWKDGGEIPAADGRDGMEVEGPGSHTDDIVPALLSAKEGVLNGEAMALGGREAMKKLNAEGLELREKGVPLHQIKKQYGLAELKK